MIISIDWDHTFRNVTGIDLNILALVLYAQSKQIPVGLTTHRDLENTTLYTLYHWQHGPHSNDERDALAAAIHYWDENLFKPLNIRFDFINARYQPRCKGINYYQHSILPLEKRLAEEILVNGILNAPEVVRNKIGEYAVPEELLDNNEFKEAQIFWLSNMYQHVHDHATLYHIDDSRDVCDFLPEKLTQLKNGLTVKTILYRSSPLFSNKACLECLSDIGLLDDINDFINQHEIENLIQDHRKCLAVVMAVLQMDGLSDEVISTIEDVLHEIGESMNSDTDKLHKFVEKQCMETRKNKHPICIMPNSLTFR
ncbi:MAG: hypothetical protein ACHQAX_02995 [Gammaproteobacteria bacterium]